MAQVKYTSVRWCDACGMMVNAERVTVGEKMYSVCARCGAREEERWGWGAQAKEAILHKYALS